MIESDFLDLLDEAQRVCGRDPVDLAGYLGARIPNADAEARAAAVDAVFRYTGSRPTLPAHSTLAAVAGDLIRGSADPDVKQSGQFDELRNSSNATSTPRCPGCEAEGQTPDSVGHWWCPSCERWFAQCAACGVCYRSPQSPYCKDGHQSASEYHPFIPYFDVGLGKQINTWAERWMAMKAEPDEDHGKGKPGVLGRPRLEYRDHPSKGELAARRDRTEQVKKERRQGHRA